MMGSTVGAVFFVALLCCCLTDSFFMTDKAAIIPVDALAFIGQTLRLQCQPLQLGISPSDMHFEISSKKDTWNISLEETVFLQNKITTEIEITSRFSSYTTVTCLNKSDYLKSAAIFVEYPIKNITNLTGTLYFDNSTIIFTWSLGESYLDLDYISVIVDWNPNSPPGSSASNCTSANKEFCSIAWGFQGIIFIRVNVSFTRYGDLSQSQIVGPPYETSAVSIHEFRPLDNLKAGPPKLLKVENVNNTCVWISWENSLYFNVTPNSRVKYKIEVKAENESQFSVRDQAERQNSSDPVTVCELVPFTKYSLSVQLRAKDINPWSDSAIVGFETEEDRPLTGPPITDTSYQVGECMGNKRDVFVYWKDPSTQSLRGRLTMFHVTSNDNRTKLLRAAYNYYTDSIDCHSASKIQVSSVTKVGSSLVPSEINIPKGSDELTFEKDLLFRVEEKSVLDDGRSTVNVTIKWDPEDQVGNIQLIVYMCQETYIPNTCFNDFETIEVNIRDKEIHLPNKIPSTTNLFGYAVKDDGGRKRGIHWTSCVYRTDTKPDQPTGVYVSPGSQANSLEISWTSTQCNRNKKVLILRYYLLICKQCVHPCVDMTCLNVTISDFSKNNYTAKNLEGGQPYDVFIQAESLAGLGPRSDVKVGTPGSASSETQRVLGITMGTVLSVLFVGLMLFCVIRHCSKSQKFFKELNKKSEIKLPKIAHQDSFDSGAYTASNPNSSNGSRPVPPSPPVDVHSLQLSTHTDSSTVSSDIEMPCGVEGADAHTHTNVSPLVVNYSGCNVPNMQSGNRNTEGRDAGGASVGAQGGCVGADEHAPSLGVTDTNSSVRYMRIRNTNLSSQPSHVTHTVVENGSIEISSDSNPSFGEIPHLPPEIQQHVPGLEVKVFHTHQVPEQTSPNGADKRQTAEQTAPKGEDKLKTAEQTAPRGDDSGQTTDYVRCCTDGDINCQMEHSRPDSDTTTPRDTSRPLKCQPLPEVTNQYQDSTCSNVEETEIKHNRVGTTVPQHSVQLSGDQALPQDSSQGLTVASSNLQEPESYDDYIRQTDAHRVDNPGSQSYDDYIRQTPGSRSYDDYIRQADANTGGDDESVSVRGADMYLGDRSNSPDLSVNSSNCSLQNNFSVDGFVSNRFMNDGHSRFNVQSGDNSQVTPNESLEDLDRFRQDTTAEFRNDPGGVIGGDSVNVGEAPEVSNCDHQAASAGYDPQVSIQASQNDSFDDEDWCCELSDESSGDVELGRREQRASSMGGSGYIPVPCTFSCSEGSDVSYNGSAGC